MKRFDQINVIPFIDIMLVLLAIVLTTATFISQGRLDINVPRASSQQAVAEIEQIDLAIDQNLVIYYQQNPVSIVELERHIDDLDRESKISFRVDQLVPFQNFIEVLDLLKQQDFERLSIITQKQP
ncbi:MAG: biopolymer transporter ExbD [Gammaproteobacteria bacterium]|nr:biopolymer transporter ExbD [Gammaproteobacteria bacterium]